MTNELESPVQDGHQVTAGKIATRSRRNQRARPAGMFDATIFLTMDHDPSRVVLAAARRAARTADRPLLLAVSGGLDSMALLSAMASVARPRIAAVATFDHGTGSVASDAVRHVCEVATTAGIPVVAGGIKADIVVTEGREAAWRSERYRFLNDAATRLDAAVVTAHTEDDQIETVLMRIMRGSGARGLAGLYAPGPVLRPFLGIRRETLARYMRAIGAAWTDDPSNASADFARNRVRRDLLPALRCADPSIDVGLLAIARDAAVLRGDVERFVCGAVCLRVVGRDRLVVASRELINHDRDSLAVLWPALAGRIGLALDRRGTRRIAEFTSSRPRNGSIPLSGGWCLEATRDAYILQRSPPVSPLSAARLPVHGSIRWGQFHFRARMTVDSSSLWTASIAGVVDGVVRSWGAGDRLEPAAGQPRRRVSRYLSDVGLRGSDRAGWPVIVAGDDVVWIPGVRRSDAATDRSGGPVRHYVCERIDR